MTNKHWTRVVVNQLGDTTRPDPIPRVGWLRHAWGLNTVLGAESLLEHRLPVDLATPLSRLAGTMDDENGLGHVPTSLLRAGVGSRHSV